MHASSTMLTSLAWLGTYLVHSTLFLGVAWLLTRQRMLKAPQLVERIWRLALFGGLLTASLQLAGDTRPSWATWMLQADLDEAQFQASATPEQRENSTPSKAAHASAAQEEVEQPRRNRAGKSMESRAPRSHDRARKEKEKAPTGPFEPRVSSNSRTSSEPQIEVSTARGPLEASDTSSSPPTRRFEPGAPLLSDNLALPLASLSAAAPGMPWRDFLLAAWITAGGLGLLGFIWACSCLIARMSKRRRIVQGPLFEQLSELRRAAGFRHEVKLFASATLEGPITYGWIRPRICLPLRALSDLSTAQQRSMLAHELAHALRRDPLWFSLYTLIVRLMCFQPLNRLARRELTEAAELLCDDWAVRWTGQRLGLASCLTEIAQWILNERRPALITAGMADHPSRLGVRVERLLDQRHACEVEPRHRWWSPTALCMLALFTSAAPGFSSDAASKPSEPEALPPHREPSERAAATSKPESTTFRRRQENSLAATPVAPASDAQPQPAAVFQSDNGPAPLNAPQPPHRAAEPSAPEHTVLQLERSMLADELTLLQLELDGLRLELEGSQRAVQFEPALREAGLRIQKLRQVQARLDQLLSQTKPTSTHPN